MASKAIRADSPKRARIVLVDDHPMVRERLAEVISREPDLTVCGEAEDHRQALRLVAATRPDLVVVDLSLKNSSGVDLIRDIRKRWPHIRTLVVSVHEESSQAERAIRAGARGYVSKQESTSRVLAAMRAVLSGQIHLSEKLKISIAFKSSVTPPDALSNRELRVFEMLGQGLGTRQIAERLQLDIHTIQTYCARIKQKLRLRDRNDLLQNAIIWVAGAGSV